MERGYEVEGRPCCPGGLARACVPFQVMNQVYDQKEALRKGTLFPELYKPYIPKDRLDMRGEYYG